MCLSVSYPSLGHPRKPTSRSRLSLDLLLEFLSNLLCFVFEGLCYRFWLELKDPNSSKLFPTFFDNFEAALFNELTDVSIPPAAVLISVLGCVRIQELVHPSDIAATVFKKQDPGVRVGVVQMF